MMNRISSIDLSAPPASDAKIEIRGWSVECGCTVAGTLAKPALWHIVGKTEVHLHDLSRAIQVCMFVDHVAVEESSRVPSYDPST
jgi:hypothetical protein